MNLLLYIQYTIIYKIYFTNIPGRDAAVEKVLEVPHVEWHTVLEALNTFERTGHHHHHSQRNE